MEIGGINGYMSNPYAAQGPQATDGKGVGPEHQIKPGKKSSPAECQTCKNRK